MSAQPKPSYHWDDATPPKLFYLPGFRHPVEVPKRRSDAEEVVELLNKTGKSCLNDGQFYQAMWKFFYSKQILLQLKSQSDKLHRACANIAYTALRMLENKPSDIYLYQYAVGHCGEIIIASESRKDAPVSLTLVQKAYYRLGEGYRIHSACGKIETNLKLNLQNLALENYVKCHQLQVCNKEDMIALARAVTVAVDWGKRSEHLNLLDEQLQAVYSSQSKSYKLIKRMLTSDFVGPIHLNFLFKQNEHCLELSKEQSICLLTTLLKKCSDTPVRMVISLIDQIQKYFKEENIPCEVYRRSESDKDKNTLCEFFLKEYASGSKLATVSQCLNSMHRTQLLQAKIGQKEYEDALIVVQQGDIMPGEINLSDIIVDLVDNPLLLEVLLMREVSPRSFKKHSKSPITMLLAEWIKSKYSKTHKIVSTIVLLLNHGGDIEDLCSYKKGSRTTAVHVATELSVLSGNIELLTIVVSKSGSSDSVDQDNKTPIHILCDSKIVSRQNEEMLLTMCELLLTRSSIEEKDTHGKTALEYLKTNDLRRVLIEKFTKHTPGISQERSQAVQQDQLIDQRISTEPEDGPLAELQPDEQPKRENASDQKEQVETTKKLLQSKLKALMEKDDSYFTVSPTHNSDHDDEVEVAETKSDQSFNKVHSSDDVGESRPMPTTSESTMPPKSDRVSEYSQPPEQNVHEVEDVDDFNLDGQCWEVVLSDRTKKFLKNSKYQAKFRKKAIKRIKEIATGEWNSDLRTSVSRTQSIYEARFSRANRIIWLIDVQFSLRVTNEFKEAIQRFSQKQDQTEKKVYALSEKIVIKDIVVDHDYIHHRTKVAEKGLDSTSISDSKEFVPLKPENTNSKRWLPKLYIPSKFMKDKLVCKAAESMGCLSWTHDDENVERDENLSKLYSLTTQHVLSLVYGKYDRRDYPIDLSDEEYSIVAIPDNQAILLLGRSGTGKTTCCLCRMWNMFKEYWSIPDRINNPAIPCSHKDGTNAPNPFSDDRVTHTPQDCTFSKENITHDSHNPSTSKSLCNDLTFDSSDHMLPSEYNACKLNSPKEQDVHLHQVFIAKNYIFCQQMRDRFYDFVAGEVSINTTTEHLSYEDKDLPSSLSEISDLSYPLFLPSRKFFLLLDQSLGDDKEFFKRVDSSDYYHDNDETLDHLLKIEMSDDEDEEEQEIQQQETLAKLPTKYTEVTVSYFTTELWPSLKQHCSDTNTDPLLVWTEIQSFIKGSFEAVTSRDGILTEREYVEIGRKRAPFFAGNREEIYKVFTEYNKLNHRDASKGLYDECDFIFSLYKRLITLTADKCLPWSIHRLYVDEVQDFTQAELAVLLRCCQDPTGFFLTGDTAQSIVRGISFRFEEVKSIFHDMRSKLNNVEVPKLHCLTINHRSHSGVTDLASSVTDLLKEYFPHSFDHNNIPRDHSKYSGPLPVFLQSCDENSLVRILLENKRKDISTVEFGAHQVVIVRNENAKSKLPNFLRKSAIALSVEESKGLEFDDVLVHNFFSDLDTCSSEVWQVVYTYLNKLNLDKQQTCKYHIASKVKWSQRKSLSAELKFLYTVITRAKVKLWFYESGPENSYAPMVEYWNARMLVRTYDSATPESGEQPILYASKSTPEQWKEQGDIYRRKKLWVQALQCYKKANNLLLVYETTAIYDIIQAKKEQKQDPEVYTKAAFLFLQCDEIKHDIYFLENLAKCLYNAQQYTEAAELLDRMNKLEELYVVHKAMNDTMGCVNVKERMGDYTGAIKLLLSKSEIDAAMQLALKYVSKKVFDPRKNPFNELTNYAHTSAQRCIVNKQNNELLKVVTLLPSVSQRVNFLKQAGLFYQASRELVNSKQYDAAFQLYQAQGMWKEVIVLAEEQGATAEKASFVLQAASAAIVKHAEICDSDIIERLLQISETEDDDLETSAHALLLLAKSYIKSDASVSLLYIERAFDLYSNSKERLNIGGFETFNTLAELQMQKKTSHSPLKFIEMAAKESIDIQNAVQSIKSTDTSSTFSKIQHVLQFYNIKRKGNVFCIPPGEHLWLKSLHECKLDNQEYDSDGMLQLDPSATINMICNHLSAYINAWLKGSIHAEQLVHKKLDEFPLHKEFIQRKVVVHSFRSCLDSVRLQEYITTCGVALLLSRVGFGRLTLERLFSPFSLICLPLNRQHFNCLKLSAPEVFNYVERVIHSITDKLSKSSVSWGKKVQTSQWLEVWRLVKVISAGHVKLETKIAEMERVVAKQAQDSQTQESFRMPFDFIRLPMDGKPTHYFTVWLRTCEAIRIEGSVLYAIHELAIPHFIKAIAKRSSLQIHTEDFVNICSILTTALFSLLAAYSRAANIFLPQTFCYMVQTFDEFNCQQHDDKKLLEACALTITRERKFEIKKVYNCLWDILDILIGRFNEWFSVLNYAVERPSQIASTEALHCLVLTLTILGNMALMHKKESMFAYQQEVLKALDPLIKKTFTDEELIILQEAYVSFAKCSGSRDIFCDVVKKLLSSKGFVLVELKTVSCPHLKVKFLDKECSSDNIPQQPLTPLTNDPFTRRTVTKLQKHLSITKAQLTCTAPVNPTKGSSAAISQSTVRMSNLTGKGQDLPSNSDSAQEDAFSISAQTPFLLSQKYNVMGVESDVAEANTSSLMPDSADDEQDSDEELPMDYFLNDTVTDNDIDNICYTCGEPNNTVHQETNEHKEKEKHRKQFESNLKWQYDSYVTELRHEISSGIQSISSISEKRHKMINEADKMLQEHNEMIEHSIRDSCNWIEGLSQLEQMTEEVENCLDSLLKTDHTESDVEYSSTEALAQDEDTTMKFEFDRQQSMDDHSNKRR